MWPCCASLVCRALAEQIDVELGSATGPGLCHLDPTAMSSLTAAFVQPYSHVVTPSLAVWGGVDPTATLSPATVFVQPYSHVVTPQSGRLRWCRPHRHLVRCHLDPTATSSLAHRVRWALQPRCHPQSGHSRWCKPHCHLVCCHLDPIATSSLAATFIQPYSHVTVIWLTSYVAVWTPQPCCHI